jgi:glyoxylase-like metal-dependent hydrolase (beta-lactamase superfamily II)
MDRTTLVALLLLGIGCGGSSSSPPVEPESEPAVESSLRLYVFDCGHLDFDTLTRFSIEDHETDVRELVVPCYIVEHPDGRMLWDGGLPSSYTTPPSHRPNARIARPLATQLAELDLGFDLSSLDYVAFSHMHYDHVGVANEIEGATWLVQQTEHEAMFTEMDLPSPAEPDLYSNMRDAHTVILDGDHDVFGDGRVRILSAPGHTPGHQVLFLDLAETGPLVLSGDLYHFRLSREDRRVPTFNFDREMTLASMERVEDFVTELGATFWIEHDLALFQTLDKAPAYYE